MSDREQSVRQAIEDGVIYRYERHTATVWRGVAEFAQTSGYSRTEIIKMLSHISGEHKYCYEVTEVRCIDGSVSQYHRVG